MASGPQVSTAQLKDTGSPPVIISPLAETVEFNTRRLGEQTVRLQDLIGQLEI